jgi:hypothetical protein
MTKTYRGIYVDKTRNGWSISPVQLFKTFGEADLLNSLKFRTYTEAVAFLDSKFKG